MQTSTFIDGIHFVYINLSYVGKASQSAGSFVK